MAPLLWILLGLLVAPKVKKLLKKHLHLKDAEVELQEFFVELAKAERDGKIDKKEQVRLLKAAAEYGLSKLIDTIKIGG
jgi:hypothetical protein